MYVKQEKTHFELFSSLKQKPAVYEKKSERLGI